jgi:hypothetical protein
MEKKSNHQAKIVRVGEPRVHTNAEKLELFDIPGTDYQVVSQKGQFKAGDLGVYIQPDSVVPQTEPFKFIWEQHRTMTEPGVFDGPVPERRRRITVRKFRGEWSEGLLLPVSDFSELTFDDGFSFEGSFGGGFRENQDVSDLLGITHYVPEETGNTKGDNEQPPHKKYPKTLKGWFYFLLHRLGLRGSHKILTEEIGVNIPHYDVESLKNYKDVLQEGEEVLVTEKIHGSQARYVAIDGHMFAGSRNFWKSEKSPCIWRRALEQHPWIQSWCMEHEGYTLYGEVTPTQKGFNYGCENGQVKFFVFDIRTPDGIWLSKENVLGGLVPLSSTVPLVTAGPYRAEEVKSLADGQSLVKGAKHIREGVVISPKIGRYERGLGRVILKLVSNSFLKKDSE